ncbi:MAG TPA: succinyldiaminopimelate transaminase [Rhodocyclaceae bacterium]|nr:succinyldiaminopimelate transaminase [Rhodocyclaceae bacterium]
MNPYLARLQPYPFERLRALFQGALPPADRREIKLSIGEPQHPTPAFIREALTGGLDGLANYPTTQGIPALRNAIAAWAKARYGLPALNAETEILPVNGSREALFSFAQAVIDPTRPKPLVVCPNPFYQIYEGAALLGGAEPRYLNTLPENDFALDFDSLSADEWSRVQLLFICSPGNPTGKVYGLEDWKKLFALSDKYGFVIASDECYSELYFGDDKPLGGLEAAHRLGRGFDRLVMFSSLSKRSNVPGMRSGFVAGDAALIKAFLLYRTYHGCAMNPAIQTASVAAWQDEAHVAENRRLYAEKFDTVTPLIAGVLDTALPDASFYLWTRVDRKTGLSDTEFARRLYAAENVVVLPGSFLARESHGVNPGAGFVRIALVAGTAECTEAAQRIVIFVKSIT